VAANNENSEEADLEQIFKELRLISYRGLSISELRRHSELLKLVDRIPGERQLSLNARTKVLHGVFSYLIKKSWHDLLDLEDFKTVDVDSSSDFQLTLIGELFGVCNEELFRQRLTDDEFRDYKVAENDLQGKARPKFAKKRLRVLRMARLTDQKAFERAALLWWPTFVAIVEDTLEDLPRLIAANKVGTEQNALIDPEEAEAGEELNGQDLQNLEEDEENEEEDGDDDDWIDYRRQSGDFFSAHFKKNWGYFLLVIVSPLFTIEVVRSLPSSARHAADIEGTFILVSLLFAALCLTRSLASPKTRFGRNIEGFMFYTLRGLLAIGFGMTLFYHVISPTPANKLYNGKVVDTSYLDSQTTNIVYPNDFSTNGPCPTLQPDSTMFVSPLTSCTTSAGYLRATMASYPESSVGIYPTKNTSFKTQSSAVFLVEARLRVESHGPLFACGIYVEGRDGRNNPFPYFFDSREVRRDENAHYPVSLGTPALPLPSSLSFSPTPAATIEPSPSEPSSSTPYNPFTDVTALGWTLPQLVTIQDSWVTLGILFYDSRYTLLVDDHVALYDQPTGLGEIDTASPAVLAGSSISGGTTSCDFDYFYVRQLPDGYRP
jgi:hypothetical protein